LTKPAIRGVFETVRRPFAAADRPRAILGETDAVLDKLFRGFHRSAELNVDELQTDVVADLDIALGQLF
jgi:hypothetical protein